MRGETLFTSSLTAGGMKKSMGSMNFDAISEGLVCCFPQKRRHCRPTVPTSFPTVRIGRG
jgi:hypothetical protein